MPGNYKSLIQKSPNAQTSSLLNYPSILLLEASAPLSEPQFSAILGLYPMS